MAIGLTGVGGGSLMTPLLIFAGIPEKIAIGTDLVYAAVTKAGGAWTYKNQGSIRWDLVFLLAAGSLPASLLTSWVLYLYGGVDYTELLTRALGLMLIVTAVTLILKCCLRTASLASQPESSPDWHQRHAKTITVIAGVALGILVTLSSVGSGAFCAVLLLTLYPRLPAVRVIGTDVAHAVPLTAVAGLGHWLLLGNVAFVLLAGLLIGSLPAVHLGAKFAVRIPNVILQPVLGVLLFAIGCKFLLG